MNKKIFTLLMLFALTATAAVSISAQKHFVANLSGRQEVPAVTTGGKGVGTLTLNAAETQVSVTINDSGLTSNVIAGHIHGDASAGANAPVLFNFSFTGGTNGTINAGPFTVTAAQVASLRARKWYFNIHTANNTGGEIRGQIKRVSGADGDYDGDGKGDVTVWRNSDLTTYSFRSLDNTVQANTFGQPGDFIFNIDYDNDGLIDSGRVRINPMTGEASAFVLRSSNNIAANLGVVGNVALGDEAITFDFDGDGKADYGTFRAPTAEWRIFESSNNYTLRTVQFGSPGDRPVFGDFDGDGKTNIGVIRNVGGAKFWYIRRTDGSFYGFPWGLSTDVNSSSQGDLDADGKDDPTVNRAVDGKSVFYTLRSSDGALQAEQWGLETDDFFIGNDFDGDGKFDYTVTRSVNGKKVWFILQSTNRTLRAIQWGNASDQ